jgi:hypothetical protein
MLITLNDLITLEWIPLANLNLKIEGLISLSVQRPRIGPECKAKGFHVDLTLYYEAVCTFC